MFENLKATRTPAAPSFVHHPVYFLRDSLYKPRRGAW
jgi:hypothetical protein